MHPITGERRASRLHFSSHTWEEAGLEYSEQNAADHKASKGLSDTLADSDET